MPKKRIGGKVTYFSWANWVSQGYGAAQAQRGGIPDGSATIEFDGYLQYMPNDPSVSGRARQVLEAWENKRLKAKVEYAYAVDKVDPDDPFREIRGGRGSVRTPPSYHSAGTIFTHIHPRKDGTLGGSFSDEDLYTFIRRGGETMRAVTKEGTYTITKGANFDSAGFKSFVYDTAKKFKQYPHPATDAVNAKYKSGGYANYNDYVKDFDTVSSKEFNNALVWLHNEYASGQRQYGYYYGLERRT